MSYNYALARMNRDRALACRHAAEQLNNPPPPRHCAACGGIVGADEPRVVVANGRRSAKTYHATLECCPEFAQKQAGSAG